MKGTDKAIVECEGLIVDMKLSAITVTVKLGVVLVHPGMYPLNAQRQDQDQT
jgi:hydrogenase maturation factor